MVSTVIILPISALPEGSPPKTDAGIRKGLREFMPETTKLIIAQRTASVEDADRIIVLSLIHIYIAAEDKV